MFGLEEAVVEPLMRSIVSPDLSTAEVGERFARATWTGIAEPGDRMAGLLVASLGASAALTAVVERWSSARTLAAIADAGGDPVPAKDLSEAFERWQPRLKSSVAMIAVKQAIRYSVRFVVPGDEEWPVGLDDLGFHAPIGLWLRGNLATLATTSESIALVGARAATGYGEHVTMEASAGLVDRGYTIISGAAYGIDGMAHRAALASSGQTIAFLAGGVDRFYPSGHDALLTRIVDNGAVLSELPCGAQPTKWRFLQRNRLIAAASQATIVMEAGWRSGSLNTAGHAAALGRPLGAVPGPVTSAASAGCHRLIRDFDAVCVTNANEMAELTPLPGSGDGDQGSASTDHGQRPIDAPQTRVTDALSTRSARTVEDIASRSGLSIAAVGSVLGTMELDGEAKERERGWVKQSV